MTGLLRIAGAVLLTAILALGGWSAHHQSTLAARPGSRRDPDLVGLLEVYGENALMIITVTEGLQSVRVTPETAVTVRDGPGTLADLRPGSLLAVWGRPSTTDPMVAAAITAVPLQK